MFIYIIIFALTLAFCVTFQAFMLSADYFSKFAFSKSFKNTINANQFVWRSGPTFCLSWSGSKQFAKVIIKSKSHC